MGKGIQRELRNRFLAPWGDVGGTLRTLRKSSLSLIDKNAVR